MTKGLHKNSLRKVDNPHQWMIDDARMKLIQQIKAEVNRQAKSIDTATGDFAEGRRMEQRNLFFFLSDLEKEEKPSEGLEEEIGHYLSDRWKFGCVTPITPVILPDFTTEDLKECARHFAQWGAEHRGSSEKPNDLPTNLDEAANKYLDNKFGGGMHIPFYIELFKAGAMWDREQGVSMEITEDTKWSEVDLFVHRNCDEMEVIQIRKKDE